MIKLKSQEEIAVMKEGGKRLKAVVEKLIPQIHEEITTDEIDKAAEKLIIENGGEPSFKRVPGYQWTICCPINEQVVHTPPSERVLKAGDIFTLDIGMFYKGFHTDFATTWIVGSPEKSEHLKFLEVGKNALSRALAQVKKGHFLGEVSQVIEHEVKRHGFFILKNLTGHGIGRDLHEEPSIPGYLDRRMEKTPKIQSGFVVAVEVIYSMGTEEIAYEKDNSWSIKTKDSSLSACFEDTVAITDSNSIILT